ncbi:hypothetical protein TRFO_10769 [Tritrichomonas foetus]|uniref:TATA-binding protein interacting (TIP20) domain-containing protein n=1 Tax=Tritrichomonas foetus TaxID=1144522 RepID=A0A1J4J9D0_9EUKA|nr:hypothetical protein TRFO_10769 [Tritrichomonas foetus]|eukprot:OHS94855.1 hypothetical protein TRFO_10769 [Tritrichomonas foetus]
MTKTWKYANFASMMGSTDIDDHINALDILIKRLESIETLDINTQDENKEIINKIMYCLEDQLENQSLQIRVSHCLRVLVLLSTRFPLDNLKSFVYPILTEAFNKYCMIRSHFVSIIKEILTMLVTSNVNRQEKFVSMMFPLCMNALDTNISDDISFPLDVTTALTESLGSLFTKDQFEQVYNKITILLKDVDENGAHDLAELAKVWSNLVNPEMLQKLITFLLQSNEQYIYAFTVLTTLIINKPDAFISHINTLVNLLYPKIDILLQGPEDDEEFSPQTTIDAQNSIFAFDALINAFPDTFRETADVYCQLAFDFFSYGVFNPTFSNSGDIDEVDELEVDGDEELGDDDAIPSDDDTWKIRKAIHFLAQTVLHKYPKTFMEIFNSAPENATNTIVFITDSDPGVKSISLQTLLLFIKTEKANLNQEIINNWICAFIAQLNCQNKASSSLIYPAFTQLVNEFGNLVPKYSLQIVECIEKAQNQNQEQAKNLSISGEILMLLNALISTSSNVDELVPSICKILSGLLKQTNYLQECMATVSLLYNHASESKIKELSDLNAKIIEIAQSKSGNENRLFTIDPLAIFVCLFSKSPNAIQSLTSILNFIKINEVYAKSAIAATSLIAASPSSNVLVSKASEILDSLKKFLSTFDSTLLFRTLWALSICIHNNIFDKKLCDSIVPNLVKLLENDEVRIQLIVVRVLQKLTSLPSVSSSLISSLFGLFTAKKISGQVVIGIAEVLASVQDDKLNPLIEKLITEGEKLSKNETSDLTLSSIALFIGYITSSHKTILDSLLKKFEGQLSGKSFSAFTIKCVGEIGSRVSLSDRKTIISIIFDLVNNNERHIFSSAAHSICLIAANSCDTILPQLIEKASKDKERLPTWISAINKSLRQMKKLKKTSAKVDFVSLFKFLTLQADFEKETETVLIECFSALLGISPSLLPQYFELISKYDKASPILSRSIASHLSLIENYKEAEQILKQILPHLNPANPATSVGAILSIKTCLRFEELRSLITSCFASLCKCFIFNEKQNVEVHYGSVSKLVDLGLMMRISTIDTISQILRIIPETLDYDLMIKTVSNGLNDPADEVKKRAITFLAKASEYPDALRAILKHVVPEITKLDVENMDLMDPLLQLIAKLHIYTQSSKVPAIERLVVKFSKQPKLKQYEEDASFANVQIQNIGEHILKSRTICFELMNKYNNDASMIFA